MTLTSDRELQATREKLSLLKQQYEATKQAAEADGHVRELTARSLKRLINQLEEEIARFKARCSVEAG
ncbi:MAG: hypothetical protein MI757_18220 [Pirellulales bacterium]|nr:hypothetical protein [Pirellulales bacterium]